MATVTTTPPNTPNPTVPTPQPMAADPGNGVPTPTSVLPDSSPTPVQNPTVLASPLNEPALTGQAGDMRFGFQDKSHGGHDLVADSVNSLAPPEDPNTPAGDQSANTTDSKAKQMIDLAMTQLGVEYHYGAAQWGKALDCSSLPYLAYKQLGIDIGRDTYSQVQHGQAVDGGIANAKPGDLLFTVGDIGMRANGHVAIYLGNGKVLAAPHTGTQVQIQDWSQRPLTAIRRYV